jgi:hypothetical protein
MEAMRQSWSDDRLDALNDRVDVLSNRVDALSDRVEAGFARVDRKFELQEERMERRFERLDAKVDSKIDAAAAELRRDMKAGFDQINVRFDAMQQTFIRVGGGLIGVLMASGAGLIATQL